MISFKDASGSKASTFWHYVINLELTSRIEKFFKTHWFFNTLMLPKTPLISEFNKAHYLPPGSEVPLSKRMCWIMLQYPVLNDFYHLKNHPVLDYRVRGHKVCLEQIYFYLIRSNLSFRDQKKTVRYYFLAETIRYIIYTVIWNSLPF